MENVATNSSLRDASTKAAKDIGNLGTELSLRKDVFGNVKAFSETKEAENLNYEEKRYLAKFLRDGKRIGLEVADDKLQEFKNITKRITNLGIEFRKCLSEDTSHFFINEEDLDGVPDDVIESMETNEIGQKKVTTKYPHYKPIIRYAKNPKTRFQMEKVYQARCFVENTERIEELVRLRHRKARMLGYPNHASYVEEVRMAKNPETVKKFLSDLTLKLKKLWSKEKKAMLDAKEAEFKELGYDFDGELNKEDFW